MKSHNIDDMISAAIKNYQQNHRGEISFDDAKVKLLCGGLVYVFEYGTHSPQTCYRYFDLMPMTNPIVADANGDFETFLCPGVFDVYLVDSKGNHLASSTSRAADKSVALFKADALILNQSQEADRIKSIRDLFDVDIFY